MTYDQAIDIISKEAKKQGVTRYKLSKETGISKSTVYRVLSRENKGSWETINKLFNYLNINANEE
jgi:transcriptional regulator with XRE-family HTH domain